MKLTYNNGETTVTIEGTQTEVFTWYKTFVHSQTGWEQNTDTAFVELINHKTYDEGVNKDKRIVNDPRAGEPDEDGWMTWSATDSEDIPDGLKQGDEVDYISPFSKGDAIFACNLKWSDFFNTVTKFRLAK